MNLAITLAPVHVWPNPKSHHGFIAKVRCAVYHPGQPQPTREDVLADNTMKDDFMIDNKDFRDIPVGSELHVYQVRSGQWFIKEVVKEPTQLAADTPSYMPHSEQLTTETIKVESAHDPLQRLKTEKVRALREERKNRKKSVKYHSQKLVEVEQQLEELGAL